VFTKGKKKREEKKKGEGKKRKRWSPCRSQTSKTRKGKGEEMGESGKCLRKEGPRGEPPSG